MKVSPPLPPAAEPQRRRVIPCAGSAYPGRASARSGFFFKAPDELVQAQRNGACRRAATTSATQHARVEGFAQTSVANAGRAILNSSAACSTPHFRARRREYARGASVTRTIHAPQAGPVGYGSQKPGDGEHLSPVKAGRDTPREGANRVQHVLKAEPAGADATDREARSKVMALEGSDSPTGRGTSGAPAVSAAPVFHSPLLRTPGRVSAQRGSSASVRPAAICRSGRASPFPTFGDASGTPLEIAGGQA